MSWFQWAAEHVEFGTYPIEAYGGRFLLEKQHHTYE